MKRMRNDTIALVYAYGCGKPLSGWEHVEREAARMRALWDKLVDIEREYEREIETRAAEDIPELASLLADIDLLSAEIRRRKGAGEDAESLSATLRAARRRTWPLLARWRAEHKPQMREIEQRRRERVRLARIEATVASPDRLHWGNSNAVLARYEAARTVCRQTGRRLRHSDPERDEGAITVQIARTKTGLGAAPQELQDGTYADLQIGMVPPSCYDRAVPRGERRRLARTRVSMRADAARNHVVLPLFLHRPLPDDARVKQAQLVWRREGMRVEYRLCLTVSAQKRATVPVGVGEVTVRVEPTHVLRYSDAHPDHPRESIRVAVASDGTEIALDEDWVREMRRVHHLPRALKAKDVPETLRRHWAMQLPGLRARLLRARREKYRLAARDIAARYGRIVIETPRLAAVAMAKGGTGANTVRHMACAHSLVAELRHQAQKRGCEVAVVVASAPTMRDARRLKRLRKAHAARARDGTARAARQQNAATQ